MRGLSGKIVDEVKAILDGLKAAMTKLLKEQVSLALQEGHSAIVNSALPMPHPVAKKFLNEYFLKFLVQVISKEGPGGISWRPVMNTIDVLLWKVQCELQKGDLERFKHTGSEDRNY